MCTGLRHSSAWVRVTPSFICPICYPATIHIGFLIAIIRLLTWVVQALPLRVANPHRLVFKALELHTTIVILIRRQRAAYPVGPDFRGHSQLLSSPFRDPRSSLKLLAIKTKQRDVGLSSSMIGYVMKEVSTTDLWTPKVLLTQGGWLRPLNYLL